MSGIDTGRTAAWKWTVCGLLFLATLLNYMDRQTLSQTSTQIRKELQFTKQNYGTLEMAFGLAFAAGGLTFGLLADRTNVWMLYPVVLLGWSVAGFLTGYASDVGQVVAPWWPTWLVHWLNLDEIPSASLPTYLGFLTCRIVLGLFEAGQWPCALVTTQRLLSQQDRPLGNSLLQSGASIGAILTPIVKTLLVSESQPGSWTILFQAIGAIGVLWLLPWFAMIRPADLRYRQAPITDPEAARRTMSQGLTNGSLSFVRMYLAVALTVILINLTWHFYRAWLPMYLREARGYGERFVDIFMAVYYLLTDVGCIAAGIGIKLLARGGWSVHSARLVAFGGCAVLTAFGMLAGIQGPGPGLMIVLLLNAAGSLALFPIYYSLTQELSARHQGKVTGTLSCLTWICTAAMQQLVGDYVQKTNSYGMAFFSVGLCPMIALAAIYFLWPRDRSTASLESFGH